MKIFSIGVEPNYPEYLQRKIVLSNQIGVLIGTVVAIPFIFISLIYFRPITFIPLIGMFVCFSTLFFNYIKMHNLARIVIGVLPSTLASFYGAFLNHAGQPALPSIAMLTLSFSFTIFLVFDIREKSLVVSTGIYVFALLILMDWLNNTFEIDMDTDVIATGYMSKLTIAMSAIIGAGSIFILVKQNQAAEAKSNQLLEEAEVNHKAMMVKESELKENLRKLEEAQEQEKKRQWVNLGLTSAAKIIRDQLDFKTLCDNLISFVVKYLNANQGGLFIVNDEDEKNVFLELRAAYAFERKKFLEKRVEIGEGILGQTYLEKQSLYLKEIPKDYLKITSGLGTSNPKSLIVVPLKINEDVLGVIELASFNEFAPYEINFLELLGENIAAAVRSRKIEENTKYLVERLQQQTEEMRAQEEEMRQNMEELSATQEEMKRKEVEYISKIARLESELK